VLAAAKSSRADDVLTRAHSVLTERAGLLDGADRATFLGNVPAHRAIMTAWARAVEDHPDAMSARPRMLATTGGRLRFVAAVILIVGLAGAIWIYLSAAPPEDALAYDPMQSKKYLHDLELYGGKANVLAVQLMDWFESLWHGTRLAYTVACAAVLLAGVFWFAAVAAETLAAEE